MAGNVQEWVFDWYLSEYYESSPKADPTGPATGEYKVVRGGSYGASSPQVEVTDRKFALPLTYGAALGFRCVKPDDPSFVPEAPASMPGDVPPTAPLEPAPRRGGRGGASPADPPADP
jgi:hypothetical protein